MEEPETINLGQDDAPQCTAGWADRCAHARSPKCTCACGGANHGRARARQAGPARVSRVAEADDSRPFRLRSFWRLPAVIRMWRDDHAHTNVPHRYVFHSPTGFEWGYGGSGPADLAFNILAMFVDKEYAFKYHQQFKWDFVAKIPREGGTISGLDIICWLYARTEADPWVSAMLEEQDDRR